MRDNNALFSQPKPLLLCELQAGTAVPEQQTLHTKATQPQSKHRAHLYGL